FFFPIKKRFGRKKFIFAHHKPLFKSIKNFYSIDTPLKRFTRFNTVKENKRLNKKFFVNPFNFFTNTNKLLVLVKKLKGLTKNFLFNRLFSFTVLNLVNLKFKLKLPITKRRFNINSY